MGLPAVHPTGDPAGTVVVRSAGIIEFSATLSCRRAEDRGPALTLPALPETVRCSAVEAENNGEGRREILGEMRALSEADLGLALETVLRHLTITAALTDAVLETRAARVVPVRVTPAAALQALALDLRDAGFGVRFGPTWTTVADGCIGLGIRGAEEELEGFLGANTAWRQA